VNRNILANETRTAVKSRCYKQCAVSHAVSAKVYEKLLETLSVYRSHGPRLTASKSGC